MPIVAPSAARAPSVLLGTLLIVLAFFCVAVMSAFGKAAAAVPTGMVVLFQNGISLVLLLPWALHRGTTDIRTTRLPMHILRAISGLLSQALFFIAVKEMSLVDAVLLVNAAPLFIPLVVFLWLKTKIRPMVIMSLVIGFVGVLLILKPSAALLANPAALLATAAALFSAIALVTVNRLSATDRPDTILFYYFLVSTIAAAPFAIAGWRTPVGVDWAYLAGIGVFMALSQLFIILAYQQSTAERLAPFNYSVVVFSGLIGWLVWHDVPDLVALLGIVLVCVGGILSIIFGGGPVKECAKGHPIGQGHWRDAPTQPKAAA